MNNALGMAEPGWDLALIDSFSRELKEAARLHCRGWPDDDGELNAAEGIRQTLRLAVGGYFSFLESNPDYSELIKQASLVRDFMLPSADAVYHYARLHGRNTYRIRGPRGSANILQFTIWNGSCSNFRSNYHLIDKMESDSSDVLAPNAEIDIVLSATKHEGAWRRLPEGECEIFVRQYYGDWNSELPAMLTIERVDAEYPPPPPTREGITERMEMINSRLRLNTDLFSQSVRFHLASSPDILPQLPLPEAMQGVAYLTGHFRCLQDQAVILEVTPPKAQYWGFQLANLQWERMQVHMRQTSLNFRQARIDSDGQFRIVISHQDPGIPNWFDTSGRALGLLSARYFKPEGVPIPTLKTVPFQSLMKHLPADTPKVSKQEGQLALRARWASAFRRFCGDQ